MKKLFILAAAAASFFVKAQSEPLLGQIAFVPYNRVPIGWAECNGQLLSIAQNTALFSLLGTTFGGNGQTNFALPDMRGRVLIGNNTTSPALSSYIVGQMGGTESQTLTVAQLPAHTHAVKAVTSSGNKPSPQGSYPANTKLLDPEYSDIVPDTTMNLGMVAPTGGNQPFNNMQPFVTMRCIIATTGIYPSFN